MKILDRVADDVTDIAMVESRAPPGRPQHDHGAAPDPQGAEAPKKAVEHRTQPTTTREPGATPSRPDAAEQ